MTEHGHGLSLEAHTWATGLPLCLFFFPSSIRHLGSLISHRPAISGLRKEVMKQLWQRRHGRDYMDELPRGQKGASGDVLSTAGVCREPKTRLNMLGTRPDSTRSPSLRASQKLGQAMSSRLPFSQIPPKPHAGSSLSLNSFFLLPVVILQQIITNTSRDKVATSPIVPTISFLHFLLSFPCFVLRQGVTLPLTSL